MHFRGNENARRASNVGAISVSIKPKKTKQQLQMDSLADKLMAKYGGKKGKSVCSWKFWENSNKKVKQPSFDEPSEEEFLKARERLDNRKQGGGPIKKKPKRNWFIVHFE